TLRPFLSPRRREPRPQDLVPLSHPFRRLRARVGGVEKARRKRVSASGRRLLPEKFTLRQLPAPLRTRARTPARQSRHSQEDSEHGPARRAAWVESTAVPSLLCQAIPRSEYRRPLVPVQYLKYLHELAAVNGEGNGIDPTLRGALPLGYAV